MNKYIEFQDKNICHVCKNEVFSKVNGLNIHRNCIPKSNLDEVSACVRYSKLVEEIIKEIKYKYHYDIVSLIADLMLKNLDISKLRNSILVPVPLHRAKKRVRGFNQAELIALEISSKIKKYGISTQVIELIRRVRNTKTQVGMTRQQRVHNLTDAFIIHKDNSISKSSKIVLVDDVMTTGSTLEECAKVLRKDGLKEIKAMVFSQA
ncbi:hypothetical protein GF362_04155 [Candidatus Dojkabacteria bacterium]|nr:hypothetical protein [Candidatus Dojkabacteria bacterium]